MTMLVVKVTAMRRMMVTMLVVKVTAMRRMMVTMLVVKVTAMRRMMVTMLVMKVTTMRRMMVTMLVVKFTIMRRMMVRMTMVMPTPGNLRNTKTIITEIQAETRIRIHLQIHMKTFLNQFFVGVFLMKILIPHMFVQDVKQPGKDLSYSYRKKLFNFKLKFKKKFDCNVLNYVIQVRY